MTNPAKPTCVLCAHKKTILHRDLLCGACVHQKIEIIRNSVVENEAWNAQMRSQINAIFHICEQIRDGKDQHLGRNHAQGAPAADSPDIIHSIPQPGRNVVNQLALKLQKLEIMRRNMKCKGLDRSCESFAQKNEALALRNEAMVLQISENRRRLEASESRIRENYSRRLEDLDKEIVSIQLERMERVSRQAVLKQYSDYMVLRDTMLWGGSNNNPPILGITLCTRPILPLSQIRDAHIETINTFLEDLIRLQCLLFDLFSIDEDSWELPYLGHLKKLLPDQKFYDSVQSKINSILHINLDESANSPDPISNENEMLADDEPPVEWSVKDLEKITIKDKTIHVPKSFRTMNLQRRSSLNQLETLEERLSIVSGSDTQTENPSMFVVVGQEHITDTSCLSAKNRAKPIQKSDLSDALSKSTAQDKSPTTRPDLSGKKIVIVPHRILTKPFSKLRPNEYLKFVSIVVKLLVTYNDFLRGVLGPAFSEMFKNQSVLGVSENGLLMGDRREATGEFIYEFQPLLLTIASLDLFFQQKQKLSVLSSLPPNVTRSNSNIDASQVSSIYDEPRSMQESRAIDTRVRSALILISPLQKVRGFYAKVMSKGQDPILSPEPFSISDKVIYGMVSETRANGDPRRTASEKTRKSDAETCFKSGSASSQYDLKEILRKVHDIISGGSGRAHLDKASANFVMQQSRAHLDDWDVVSKMF